MALAFEQEVVECQERLFKIENELQCLFISCFQEKYKQIQNSVDILNNVLSKHRFTNDLIRGETVPCEDVDEQLGVIVHAAAALKSTLFEKYTPSRHQRNPDVRIIAELIRPETVTFSGWLDEICKFYKLYYRQGEHGRRRKIAVPELRRNAQAAVVHLMQVEQVLIKMISPLIADCKEKSTKFRQYDKYLLYLPALANLDLTTFVTTVKDIIIILKQRIFKKCSLVFDKWPQQMSCQYDVPESFGSDPRFPNPIPARLVSSQQLPDSDDDPMVECNGLSSVTVLLFNFEGIIKFHHPPIMRLMTITEHTWWSIRNEANIVNEDLPRGFQIDPLDTNDPSVEIHEDGAFLTKQMESMSVSSPYEPETFTVTVSNLVQEDWEQTDFSSAFLASVDLPGIQHDTTIKVQTIAPMFV